MNEKMFSEAISELKDKYYEEAAQYERKRKNLAWIKWGAMVACLCLVVAAGIIVPKLINPAQVESSSQFAADAAPMVYVNDRLYRQSTTQTSYAELNEEFIYLGEIESEVINDQRISNGIPNKNFQANHPIVGSKVYQYGDDVVVEINGKYWLYEYFTDVVIVP